MLNTARLTCALGAALWLAAAGSETAAQVPATNDVAACTLLADPTAQRSCIESARQKRAATSFDPSASRFKVRPRPSEGDSGLRRSFDLDGSRRHAVRRPKVRASAEPPAQMP